MPKLTLLTSEHCPPCRKLKEALAAHPLEGYEVRTLRVEDDGEADEILQLIDRHRLTHLPVAIRDDGAVCELVVGESGVEVDCEAPQPEAQAGE